MSEVACVSGSMLEIESAAEVIACMSGSMLDMSLLLKLIKRIVRKIPIGQK
jgi:hypothetical protein